MKRMRLALAILVALSVSLAGCEPGEPGPKVPGDAAWSYIDPADPTVPALIETTKGESSFHLKPDWEVISIEYADAWWGLGEPGLHNQTIKRDGDTYKLEGSSNGATTVSEADVQALIKAIAHLYPAQMLMQGHAWTDDYPSWAVEITGTDGQHILLNASSTGNPGNGPWTVLYNSRLYAQYDGSVAKPLGKLFGGRLGQDDSPFPDSGRPAGQVNFATAGLPPQLTYGFWGLLPISQDFSYMADASKGAVKGQITGSSRIGSMEIGEINKLDSLQLTVESNQVACKVETLPEGDPWTARVAWEFTCPVQGAKDGDRYTYPMKAHFATSKGQSLDVTGELWGKWASAGSRDYILLPPPPELKDAISAHPAAQDLMTDHILGSTSYSATLDAAKPLGGRRGGEAILYGQTQVDGKVVRYTVGAQFVVQDGKLTYWDLDRAALNDTLKAVAAQPLTGRVMAAKPNAALNLWYAKGTPPQERSFMNDGPGAYSVSVNPCGAAPGGAFPGSEPLRAFGYNASPYFDRPPFVLIEGKPVVSEIGFSPNHSDPVQKALLPDALDTGTSKPFEFISMATTSYSGGGPTLRLGIPQKAGPSELAIYEERIKALSAPARAEESQRVMQGVTLSINKDGKLEVVSCSSSQPVLTPRSDTRPPTLVYSTYYGSPSDKSKETFGVWAIGVDSDGHAHIIGSTSATDLPLKNAFNSTSGTFVAKLNQDGSDLDYATYLGMGHETYTRGGIVGGDGAVYVLGTTYDGSVPEHSITLTNRSEEGEGGDAFLTKVSADGKKVEFSIVLGGSNYDEAYAAAVDPMGNIYVIGETRSPDFPITNSLQPKFNGPMERWGESFIAKISPDGKKLLYSTFLGGSAGDSANGVTTDAVGNLYVVGSTSSPDFPLKHSLQAKITGKYDIFLMKVTPDGAGIVFSTLLGGSKDDVGIDVALDTDGNIYLAGNTTSPDFPMAQPLFAKFNGGVSFSRDEDKVRDAFVAKLNPEGSAVLFSTFLGGSGEERERGLGLDADGNIYVGGTTTSPDFALMRPIQKDYSDIKIGIAPDSFITKLDPTGATLVYSTYFGVDGFDELEDLAVDKNGDVYFSGSVDSSYRDFPLAGKPFQSTNEGTKSVYIAKIADEAP